MTKACKVCGVVKDLTHFSPAKQCKDGHRSECKACHNSLEKARNKESRVSYAPEYRRAERFKRLYGITLKDYERLLEEQGNVCKICGDADAGWKRTTFVVDHDHSTGKVRGLLCHSCNIMLGMARDRADILRQGMTYLGAP